MEKILMNVPLLLLAHGLLVRGATNISKDDGVTTTTSSAATTGIDEDHIDYMELIRGALAQAFVNIPTPLKSKLLGADVSVECRVGLLRTLRAFLNLELWALRLFDASGKFPTGALQGARADMGAFDECLDTVEYDEHGQVRTRGQYCNLVLYVKNSTAMESNIDFLSGALHPTFLYFKNFFIMENLALGRIGMCFIDSCCQDDMQALVDTLKLSSLRLEVSNCVTSLRERWTLTQIAIASLLGVLLVVVISATIVEHIMNKRMKDCKKPGTMNAFLGAFSATSNTRDLLKVADRAEAELHAMQFLHGMRLLSMLHIVLGHLYTTLSDSWTPLQNLLMVSREWTYIVAAAGFNSVDTFFFLSGFLLCFTVTKQKRNGPIVFITDVVRRLIRICVPLFFVIMCLYLLPRIVTGPDAKGGFQKLFDEVDRHGWHMLLHTRNFYENTVYDVFVHTWYLSADFQLYVVALPTLLILKGHKTALVAAFAVYSFICCAVGTWVVARQHLLPIMIFPGPVVPLLTTTMNEFYLRPYYHAVCYFSGCMTFLLMADFRRAKITKDMQLACWCISVSCGLISVFAKMAWYRSPNPVSEPVTLIVAFSDRILWSVFIAWVTLACSSGRGGFIGRFFSWNAFVPLSKLSFGVYLIHLPFMHLMLHASKERVYWSMFNVSTLGFGVLVWSFLLSYLAYLVCEGPTSKLNSLMFGRIIGRGDARKNAEVTEPGSKSAMKAE